MPASEFPVLEKLQAFLAGKVSAETGGITFPPAIAKTIGFALTAVGPGTATMTMATDVKAHANPMGTVHGGVLCDFADAAIGTAHATTLKEGESFTSVDLKINFFKPLWNAKIKAIAKPIHSGKNVSYYACDIFKEDGSLVATVTSTVMTLRGDAARGR